MGKVKMLWKSKVELIWFARRGIFGFFFLWPLKSHQMTTFLIQNKYWDYNDFILVKTSSFCLKEVVMWWLFNDKSQRKKEPQMQRPNGKQPYDLLAKLLQILSFGGLQLLKIFSYFFDVCP